MEGIVFCRLETSLFRRRPTAQLDPAVAGGYEPIADPALPSETAASADVPTCTPYGLGGESGFVVTNNTGAAVDLTAFYALCIAP